MLADNQAILYRNITGFESSFVYGCAFVRGRSFELGRYAADPCGPGICVDIEQEVLAGPLAAYGYFSVKGEKQTYLIIVRDLRNDHVLHQVPTGLSFPPDPHVTGNGPASSISLKSNGSVAWITADSVGETTHYEVHALDKTGNRLLATGTDIDPHSLALAGSTLYWTQAGRPYSTSLD
jgi:hypothetical protein